MNRPSAIRVLSWNLNGLRGASELIVETLRQQEPDVVCLQELPRGVRGAIALWKLARKAGLVAVSGGLGSPGLAVLVRPEITANALPIVHLPRRRRYLMWLQYPRGITSAEVHLDGWQSLTFSSVHLSTDRDERLRHLDWIMDFVEMSEAPLIVAGDMNEIPGREVWTSLGASFIDASETSPEEPTFPADNPRHRIDAIFIDQRLMPMKLAMTTPRVVDEIALKVASDHLPVVVDCQQVRRRTAPTPISAPSPSN